ncbi:hypothetical protein OEA41_003465 [Lepraria neglecta]|uniref:Uncharacterized protein n=1 Tax=Lepraria neglecta TaxID=209136 RepID=A0AAD9Z5R9_9LECA|nr:hypothetical protein OEA41_003465 [Lepraria neglecta]
MVNGTVQAGPTAYHSLPAPPVDCDDSCQITGYAFLQYWPVDNSTGSTQNKSAAAASSTYVTVSDGFTFFNITVAYEPDALSTRVVCNTAIPDVTRAINYTELQYRITMYDYATCPIHTLLWSPYTQLVWPAGLTEGTVLDPSWRTCTPIQIGAFDAPRMLNKATAMASEGPFPAKPPVPAPAAQIAPANAPATPTPNPTSPTNNAPQPAPQMPPLADPGPNSEPKETGVPGPQGPPLSSDPSKNRPASGESHGADPPSDSTPQNDPPNKNPTSNGLSINNPYQAQEEAAVSSTGNTNSPPQSNDRPQNGQANQEDSHPGTNSGQHLGVGAIIFTPGPTATLVANAQDHVTGLAPPQPVFTVSIAPNGRIAIINGVTSSLQPNTLATPVITIGNQASPSIIGGLQSHASAYVIHGQTLISEGPVIIITGSPTPAAGSPQIYAVGGQIFTANPTSIPIAGTTLTPGGPGITVAGTPIRLAASGTLIIGSSTIAVPRPPTPPPQIYTIGDQIFTANSSAISKDGTTITSGGLGVTIAGTIVSMPVSGTLITGDSTIAISIPTTPTPSPVQGPASVYTIGNKIFTANPSAISVDGTTIKPCGPGVTIAGTPVSLLASGTLAIGNSTITVSSTNASASASFVAFKGIASKIGSDILFWSIPVAIMYIYKIFFEEFVTEFEG